MLNNWLSPDNAKWLVATLAIPVTLGYVSNQYQSAQAERQTAEARLKMYTELLSKREEADTVVRRGIFDKVLETYLKPGAQDLEGKIVALEMLSVNFNDSLDLGPLFWQLDHQISRAPGETRPLLLKQLQRIAKEVKDRQVATLEVVGDKRDATIDLENLATAAPLIDEILSFPDPDAFAAPNREMKREFKVEVAEHDAARRRVWARVSSGDRQWAFWVDAFDFPLANFVRVSKTERFTVLLKRYEPPSAQVTVVYFPSARGGVRDKPFIDEVISDLVRKR